MDVSTFTISHKIGVNSFAFLDKREAERQRGREGGRTTTEVTIEGGGRVRRQTERGRRRDGKQEELRKKKNEQHMN